VRLTLTQNRVSMASVQFLPHEIRVRLHEAFLNAPATVLNALGAYLRSRRDRDWTQVGVFARSIPIAGQPAAPITGSSAGRVYDLDIIRRRVNKRFFEDRLTCRVIWGRNTGRKRKYARSRSICYGTYRPDQNLVRIHPRLDRKDVPEEFVEYIVFHEMLHAAIPARKGPNGHRHHPAEFKVMEKRFPGYRRMKAYSKQFIHNHSVT